jgi:hypothetical protein
MITVVITRRKSKAATYQTMVPPKGVHELFPGLIYVNKTRNDVYVSFKGAL